MEWSHPREVDPVEGVTFTTRRKRDSFSVSQVKSIRFRGWNFDAIASVAPPWAPRSSPASCGLDFERSGPKSVY